MASQALKFKNFTDRDFTWSFDSIPYTFKAGESIYLEDFKAKHFAKHLVDRELDRLNIPTSRIDKREELEAKCFEHEEPVSTLQALNIEETKKEKKVVKKEEEFADLKAEKNKKIGKK